MVCNAYPWFTFYRRQDRVWNDELESGISEVKQSGADSIEPSLGSLEQVDQLAKYTDKYDLGMQTVYVNSQLHETAEVEPTIQGLLPLVERAKKLKGTNIVVTNPSPIQWGSKDSKTDEQLATQRDGLEALGKALSDMGVSLAYHFHDIEFLKGAREVHHMLAATDPRYVKLCLDTHWVYRGAGDSNVALYDIITLYGDRIIELHIRQSQDGIWTETFGPGDIDYPYMVEVLKKRGIKPVVCMEQAVQKESPNTMDGFEAHIVSHSRGREVFAPIM